MVVIYEIKSVKFPHRFYIGSSSNYIRRTKQHKAALKYNKHHSILLQNHYNKYGEEDLLYSPIIFCDEKTRVNIEQSFITTCCPFFNIQDTVEPPIIYRWREDRFIKASNKLKGRHVTDTTKEKMSIAMLGKKKVSNSKNILKWDICLG